jgi:hypothetical protein
LPNPWGLYDLTGLGRVVKPEVRVARAMAT